ncbi:uncharacterized protein LOC142576348 [Dermacentor variabilis]|uniref:uncharacterized protein LOC142576348 n=1 Tax=Dermacentor variabilis TaxID=34621 RepID=UPI003F5CAC58
MRHLGFPFLDKQKCFSSWQPGFSVLLASTVELLASQVPYEDGLSSSLVKTLVKRSPTADANKRVRRGILDAAMKAKALTTAAIHGIISMKNKMRELKGDEEDDEPFRPIDVDAILREESGKYDDESPEDNTDTSPAQTLYPGRMHTQNYPNIAGHANGIPRQEFRKGW